MTFSKCTYIMVKEALFIKLISSFNDGELKTRM